MPCKSGIAPLQMGFSNVTLEPNGQSVTSNGIAMAVGSPGQIIAITPSTLSNNTIIMNRGHCAYNDIACVGTIGGGFNASQSSTFMQTTLDAWNGSVQDAAYYDALLNVPGTYFNDDLTIGVKQEPQTFTGFPLLLASLKSSFYSQLGIGSNSTFIDRVVEAGFAPSRSYSFFAGIYSSVQAGVLVIGGYSDRFYEGELYTKSLDGMTNEIHFGVTKMVYEEDGQTTDLMPDNFTEFRGYIDPFYPTLIMPNSTATKFATATNATYLPKVGLFSYASTAVPKGNITVTMENNITTVIPNYALFDPPAYDNGILSVYRNGSESVVYGMITTWETYGSTVEDIAVFGMPYAAMIYIIQDYERQTASIGNANQNAQIGGDLTAICSLNKFSHGSSNHAGAIAGGVVGGVVGLALIALLGWFLWRRKKRATAANRETKDVSEVPGVAAGAAAIPQTPAAGSEKPELSASDSVVRNRSSVEKPTDFNGDAAELSSGSTRVEMPGSDIPPSELPGQENKVVMSELPG